MRRTVASVCLAVGLSAVPALVLAHAYSQDVYVWGHTTSAASVLGPVTTLRIHFNALRYAQPGTTVAVVENPPLDYSNLLKGASGVGFTVKYSLVSPAPSPPPSFSANAACAAIKPENLPDPARKTFPADLSAAIAVAVDHLDYPDGLPSPPQTSIPSDYSCLQSALPAVARAKALSDEIDLYKKIALDADNRLADQPTAVSPAVVRCAQALQAQLDAVLHPSLDKGSAVAAASAASKALQTPCTYSDDPIEQKRPNPEVSSAISKLCADCYYSSQLLTNDDQTTANRLETRIGALSNLVSIASKSGKIGANQAFAWSLQLKSAADDLKALQVSGAVGSAYQTNYTLLKVFYNAASYAVQKDNSNSETVNGYFVFVDTTSGICSGNATGGKRTVTITATDMIDKTDLKRDAAVVNCLARDVLSAGIGYTGLRATSYTTEGYLNGQTKIVATNNNGQITGEALANWCICHQRLEDPQAFGSVGVTTAGSNPIGLFGGLSTALFQRYFLSLGYNYGYENQLDTGTVNQFVPSSFKVTQYHKYVWRFAAMFSIGL